MGTEATMGVIARQNWMQPLEEGLQKALHKLFGAAGPAGQKAKDFLNGTWVGHPLHVILTDIPLGTWTAAVAFDALDAASGRKHWKDAADAAIAMGLVGAAGAAVTGLTDWQDIDPPARRIGLTHAALNVGGVALFTASLLMRRRKSRGLGQAFSLLGYGLAMLSARLGGNLVYGQAVGVDHTAGRELPEKFTPVLADSALIAGQTIRSNYRGTPVLLVRSGERIFAMVETCSHLGGPLSEGKLEDDTIQCPWHGSRFALEDGRVLNGPATHPQPCLEARVHKGQIEIRKRTPASEPSPTAVVEPSPAVTSS
ncbi:MAG: Rieske 2Fe-2S domain-containing protein [Acidobacteriia bacterium]|nr:Rieske 2Fe-2S domain-containing protein [Terriglobia bacterium]